MGITIIPPDAVQAGGIEMSLNDAQREAAAEILPGLHANIGPETKGRERISLAVSQWEDWSRLADRG